MNTMKILAIVAIAGATAFGCSPKKDTASPDTPPQACTKDAKVCEDGSTVSREGPACEFAACPEEVEAAASEEIPEGDDVPDGDDSDEEEAS